MGEIDKASRLCYERRKHRVTLPQETPMRSLEEQVVGRQREVYTGKIEHYKQSIEKREINVSEEMHIFCLTGS